MRWRSSGPRRPCGGGEIRAAGCRVHGPVAELPQCQVNARERGAGPGGPGLSSLGESPARRQAGPPSDPCRKEIPMVCQFLRRTPVRVAVLGLLVPPRHRPGCTGTARRTTSTSAAPTRPAATSRSPTRSFSRATTRPTLILPEREGEPPGGPPQRPGGARCSASAARWTKSAFAPGARRPVRQASTRRDGGDDLDGRPRRLTPRWAYDTRVGASGFCSNPNSPPTVQIFIFIWYPAQYVQGGTAGTPSRTPRPATTGTAPVTGGVTAPASGGNDGSGNGGTNY